MAGDMFVAALIDCGLDLQVLENELRKLPVDNFRITSEEVKRGAIRACHVAVHITAEGREQTEDRFHDHQSSHSHSHGRSYRRIIEIIRRGRFSPETEARALAIFRTIAEAEARVHGTSVEEVHFHEVGAIDSIVDVCAAALAVELLGISKVTCSAIGIGRGVRRMAHGEVPIPAPATAEILRGLPVRRTEVEDELLTPTGAAILKVLVDDFHPCGDLVFQATGYGAGTADRADPPNVVRAQLFRASSGEDPCTTRETITVLETEVDDCSGEIMGQARQLLEDAGALDVLVQSVQMKKNRPGFLLTVVATPDRASPLEDIILRSTSTFGVRRYDTQRRSLERQVVTVHTPLGGARIKLGILHGEVIKATPEFVDCDRLAKASGVSLIEVMALVERTFRENR